MKKKHALLSRVLSSNGILFYFKSTPNILWTAINRKSNGKRAWDEGGKWDQWCKVIFFPGVIQPSGHSVELRNNQHSNKGQGKMLREHNFHYVVLNYVFLCFVFFLMFFYLFIFCLIDYHRTSSTASRQLKLSPKELLKWNFISFLFSFSKKKRKTNREWTWHRVFFSQPLYKRNIKTQLKSFLFPLQKIQRWRSQSRTQMTSIYKIR